ncbi:MAG: single-stranded-DNA-specific exonuclease RecJ [Abditibacteriota bacterium]|nr:single-stranded-DNA-specific exonuclease RecJ [Abditibacteriota bacterium]
MRYIKKLKILEPNPAIVERIRRECGVSPIVARVLANRNLRNADIARRFLNPTLDNLGDPALLPDGEKAADMILSAIESGEKILIYGDYDVDGITSGALMTRFLRCLEGDAECMLPERDNGGYDLNSIAVEKAAAMDVSLIITCDCGSKAFEAVEAARNQGMKIIITDHHTVGDRLPSADAVVNPKRPDSAYFPNLAGVGVAFTLCRLIVRRAGLAEASFVRSFIDLAALGTVADMVPLLGENRVIAANGLPRMAESKKEGFRALMSSVDNKPVTSETISFFFAPRINSAGRMKTASIALDMFLTKDPAEAARLCGEITDLNEQRKECQKKIFDEAERMMLADPDFDKKKVVVLAGKNWHRGIIGIVSGNITEKYGKPSVILTNTGDADLWVGSARSINTFSLVKALGDMKELFVRFGGHSLAAGLTLHKDNIAELDRRLNEIADRELTEADVEAVINLDAELEPSDCTFDLVNELKTLEPFGTSNPEPLFLLRNARIVETRIFKDSHLSMTLDVPGGGFLKAIAFRKADAAAELGIEAGSRADICFNLRINEWNGNANVQLNVEDIRLSEQ